MPPGWNLAYGVMLYTLPFSAIHASLPFRPVWFFSIVGVTFKYGLDGGIPRKSALGPDMRAQSKGEQPGSSMTLRLGFWGFEECDGGGARPLGESDDGGPRLGTGPRARCIELAAGNWPRDGTRPAEGMRPGAGGGGIMEPRELVEIGSERVKLGTGCEGIFAVALGVVASSGSSSVGG